MATNRTRRRRQPIGSGGVPEDIYEAFAWNFTLNVGWGKHATEAEIEAAWREYKAAILERYIAEMKAKNRSFAGKRPRRYFAELEATSPRRKIRTGSYWGCWTKDGPPKAETEYDIFEGDLSYVVRLGVAVPWELAEYERRQRDGEEDVGVFD